MNEDEDKQTFKTVKSILGRASFPWSLFLKSKLFQETVRKLLQLFFKDKKTKGKQDSTIHLESNSKDVFNFLMMICI